MSYRPQFAFFTPPGFRDEQFHYSFDSTNTPGLSQTIAAGATLRNIALQTQQDAEFICRALKIQSGTSPSALNIQIKNSFDRLLSVGQTPIYDLYTPSGAAIVGSFWVPFEDEMRCPAGAFLELFITNLTSGTLSCPALSFYGVKRYRAEDCAR